MDFRVFAFNVLRRKTVVTAAPVLCLCWCALLYRITPDLESRFFFETRPMPRLRDSRLGSSQTKTIINLYKSGIEPSPDQMLQAHTPSFIRQRQADVCTNPTASAPVLMLRYRYPLTSSTLHFRTSDMKGHVT